MTLRTRIALVSAVAVAVVVVAAVVVAHNAVKNQLLSDIDQSLVERVALVQRVPVGPGGQPFPGAFMRFGADELLGRGARGFDALFLQYVAPDGTVAAPRGQPVTVPVTDQDVAIAAGSASSSIRTELAGPDRLRVITAPALGGAVQMARSLDEFDRAIAGITGTLTLIGGVGVALAGLLGLVVARGALKPLDDLTETVEHVTETRELAARIETSRNDEVGRLARSFNAMLEALEGSRTQQRQLVRDAGHELRTPLTALRTNIEVLARTEDATPEQRRELLEAATSELAELSDLAVELVELAADPDAATEPVEEVALDALAERVVERFRRRIDRPIELVTAPSPVTGRPAALERAVGNLIDNAGKFSPPQAPIRVMVGSGRVAVTDHGPGIAEEDRPHVFDRFYRSTVARTTPGSGLGLAIVKKVVDEHGGSVFVESPATGGTTVGFTLPPRPSP